MFCGYKQDDTREMAIAKMNNEAKIVVAQIQAKATLDNTTLSQSANTADSGMGELLATVQQKLEQVFGGLKQLGDAHQSLERSSNSPKKIVRDKNGNIIGVQGLDGSQRTLVRDENGNIVGVQ